jgi:hypothetical protein
LDEGDDAFDAVQFGDVQGVLAELSKLAGTLFFVAKALGPVRFKMYSKNCWLRFLAAMCSRLLPFLSTQ